MKEDNTAVHFQQRKAIENNNMFDTPATFQKQHNDSQTRSTMST